MIAYCIFMNDSFEAVVLDNIAQADRLLKVKARQNFIENAHNYYDLEAYKMRCFWHIHDVEVTKSL